MSDFLITLAIVVPTVLGVALFIFWKLHRAVERRVQTLASRLKCPICGMSSLVWTAEWAINEPDTNGEVSGYRFLCSPCGKEFNVLEDGTLFHHPELDLDDGAGR